MRRRLLPSGLLLAALPGPFVPAQTIDNATYRETVLAIQRQMQAGELVQAEAQLTAARIRFPDSGGLENLQGVLAIRQGKPELARNAFQQAIHHSPKLVAGFLNLARLDLSGNTPHQDIQTKEALRLYDHVLELDPTNTEANIESADLLLAEGEAVMASKRISAINVGMQKDPRAQAVLCGAEAQMGHTERANVLAGELAADPTLSETDVETAAPGLRAARRADLLERLLTAVEDHAALSSNGLRLLGLAQEAEGNLAGATATLEQAFAMDATSPLVLRDLGRIAAAQGKEQEALGYLAHARELAPKDASLAFEFGAICFRMNLLGEAEKAIKGALALRPDNPEYVLAMAKITTLSQDPLSAAPYFEHYRLLKPEDPEGKLLTGAMYFRAKDFEGAVPWLKEAAAAPATRPSAELYLGSIARQQNDYEQALTHLVAAVEAQPNDAQSHAELGQTYLQMKRYTEAGAELDRAIALDPMSYTGNFGLVLLYAHNNDPRRAAQASRFEEVKSKRDQDMQQAMRVIEVRPDASVLANR